VPERERRALAALVRELLASAPSAGRAQRRASVSRS
jgi:hypothetical protein